MKIVVKNDKEFIVNSEREIIQPGDTVGCNDNKGVESYLTKTTYYEVIAVHPEYGRIEIKDDNNKIGHFNVNRFFYVPF